MSHYIAYYDAQVGGGVDHVFVGSPYQRGYGVGSFLAGLFRKALPLLKRGARAVSKEAMRAGLNIMDDVSNHDIPFKQSFKARARETGATLKRKAEEKIDALMSGSGYKRARPRRRKQLKKNIKRGRTGSKKILKKKNKRKTIRKKNNRRKKKRTVVDIFGPA